MHEMNYDLKKRWRQKITTQQRKLDKKMMMREGKKHKQRKVRICHTFLPFSHHLIWILCPHEKWKSNNNKKQEEKIYKNHSSWFFDSVIRALPSFFVCQMKSEMCDEEEQEKGKFVTVSLAIKSMRWREIVFFLFHFVPFSQSSNN